jgi:hypothetical protein
LYYLNWQSWDYETHPEGKFYKMKSLFDCIFEGYMIDSILHNSLSFVQDIDIEKIEKQNPQNKSLLISTLKEKINIIVQNKMWIEFFKRKNIDNHHIDTIKNQLNTINATFEIKNAQKIVAETLDITKINDFKVSLYNKWQETKFIRKIFEYFNKKQSYSGQNKLSLVGQNMFLQKGKRCFTKTDTNDNFLLVLNDLGSQLSKLEDKLFFRTVLNRKTETVYKSVIEGLNKSIEILRNEKHTPTVIFLDSLFEWFGLKDVEKWSNEKTIEFSNGSYDKIPVFFVNARLLEKRFLVADFGNTFTMLCREYSDRYDNELKIDVTDVTDDIANEKFANEIQKWKFIDGNEISDADALTYIKTSVIIDFDVVENYEILDDKSFEIGLIET